jgi:hypothetical protein
MKSRKFDSKETAVLAFVLLAVALVVALSFSSPFRPPPSSTPEKLAATKAVIDLPSIALKKRAEVERVLGKPNSFLRRRSLADMGDDAVYSWGTAGYQNERLTFLFYSLGKEPVEREKAFAQLGLSAPTKPYTRAIDGNMIWTNAGTLDTGFSCCNGLVFKDIFIAIGPPSEIHLWLIDLDESQTWTKAERKMWVDRTHQPIPSRGAKTSF